MASWRLRIPPRVQMDECVACRVTRGGTAVAWRNHAHRLARDIYSEHFARNGTAKPRLGFISAQQPQIFRVIPESRVIEAGETLLLHCLYDSADVQPRDRVTFLGVDERTHEMCNQYLMATVGLTLNCNADRVSIHTQFAAAHQSATAALTAGNAARLLPKAAPPLVAPSVGLVGAPSSSQLGGPAALAPSLDAAVGLSGLRGVGVGQVVGVAIDERRRVLYALHRAGGTFASTTPVAGAAILAYSYMGELRGGLAKGVFTVPHGLSVDFAGYLWATDVHLHQVLKLDPSSGGAVILTLGTARAPGRGSSSFNKPTDVAVHPTTREVFVADGYGNSRVAVFTYDGAYLRQFGSAGSGDGQFRVPHSLVFDKRDDVYVADRENSRVQVFSYDGKYKAQWLSHQASSSPRYPYSRHVSSISYDATLDLFAVCEGDAVVMRTVSGCSITQTESLLWWPHDAVLLPAASASLVPTSPPNLTAVAQDGAQYALFVAELDGRKLKRYDAVIESTVPQEEKAELVHR